MAVKGRIQRIAIIALVLGVVSLAIGGVFIAQAISKQNMITEAMKEEKVTYQGVDGVIDTPAEAALMAGVLKEHRFNNYGFYSELKRDDPKRDQILKAITLETSLNLAQMGYGLTQALQAIGLFMILVGLGFGVTSFSLMRMENWVYRLFAHLEPAHAGKPVISPVGAVAKSSADTTPEGA
ncbi:MAG: hypothetical protein V1849_01200 [Chloroflexota bacterium]